MKIHARIADAVLVGFYIFPVTIQAAGCQIVQGITVWRSQSGQFSPVHVAGNKDHAVGACFPDQIDHADQFLREVGPRFPAVVFMPKLNTAANNSQVRWLLQTLFQPFPLRFAQQRLFRIRIRKIIILP